MIECPNCNNNNLDQPFFFVETYRGNEGRAIKSLGEDEDGNQYLNLSDTAKWDVVEEAIKHEFQCYYCNHEWEVDMDDFIILYDA